MKNILVLILAAPLFSLAAQTENVVIYKKTAGVVEDSSEHNRLDKNHQVTAQLVGVNPSGIPGGGLFYGYFLDRSSMVVVEATGSEYTTSGIFGGSYDVEASTFGVHFKKFFGNSFYVRTGIDQRHIDLKHNYNSIVSSSYNTAYGFKSDSTAVGLVIGNQWQWNNFTLGCDWIGMSVPFIQSTSDEYLSANADSIDVRDLEEDKRRYSENGIAQGLRFYLGASF